MLNPVRGKIKVIQGDKLEVVTIVKGDEQTDWFTFAELLDFINNRRTD